MKRLLSIVLVFTALGLSAQQDPQFTMNFANKLFNNPAYAGTNKICATGIFRNQWTAFEGAPRDILFSIHSPIKLKLWEESSLINPGVGFTFINDQIGPISTNGFKLALANHMRFSNIGTISIGAGLGALGVAIDPSKFVTPDGQNASTGINDPGLANTNLKGYGFDLDFGVYYQSSDDKIWAGASMLHIIPNEYSSLDNNTGGQTKYRVQSHMYFMGGYNYSLNADWVLKPSAFVKTELITTQVDLNIRAEYQEKIWGGVSWRFQDAVAFMAGYNWNNIGGGSLGNAKVGFSYDLNTSKLFKHNVGTFEIFVNYCFGITPKPKISIHKNPLWL